MLSLGPVPMTLIIIVIAWGIGTVAGRFGSQGMTKPRPAIGSTLLDMLLIGLLTARIAFIVAWWPLYAAAPWTMLRLGDGGYMIWVGALAGMAWGIFCGLREPKLRRPLAWGTLAALLAWAALTHAVQWQQRSSVALPDAVLIGMDDRSTRLAAFLGRPIVVNLWASWCPSCRREMPALADAQDWYTDVHFIFVNQGEDSDTVAKHLAAQGLTLDHVLLDPHTIVAASTGARGLPTTLFFDANGKLEQVHVGELTRAGLAHRLRRLSDRPPMRRAAEIHPHHQHPSTLGL